MEEWEEVHVLEEVLAQFYPQNREVYVFSTVEQKWSKFLDVGGVHKLWKGSKDQDNRDEGYSSMWTDHFLIYEELSHSFKKEM